MRKDYRKKIFIQSFCGYLLTLDEKGINNKRQILHSRRLGRGNRDFTDALMEQFQFQFELGG